MFKILENSDVPLNRTQIADLLNEAPEYISKIIGILLKHQDIKCIELDRYQSAKLLGWDIPIRRTRFYYVNVKKGEIKKWVL